MAGTAQRSVLFTQRSDQRQAHELFEATGGRVDRLVAPGDNASVEMPADLVQIVQQVLAAVARGGTVVVNSVPDEFTTTVAAEQLGVSRPTLMKMIENGEIASRKVGSHHRLKSADVQTLKRTRLDRQRKAFEELRQLEEELDEF